MLLDRFITYLEKEKHMASNSLLAYKRDILAFQKFINKRGLKTLEDVSQSDVIAYLMELKNSNKSKATVNRKLASIRAYYRFAQSQGAIKGNPTENIKSPKIERKDVEYLSLDEIEKILDLPDNTVKGKRDKAILELMYATGIRVTELIELKPEDVNLNIGFISCNGDHGAARIIPFGAMAKKALKEYMQNARNELIKSDEDLPLFVNFFGEEMTRQGVWKILKSYGTKAKLEQPLTPHLIRNSFAVHLVQNGADIQSLQEMLGHEDIMATKIYLTVKKSRIKDVYDKAFPRA